MTTVTIPRGQMAFVAECLGLMVHDIRRAAEALSGTAFASGMSDGTALYTATFVERARIEFLRDSLLDRAQTLEHLAMTMDSREFDRAALAAASSLSGSGPGIVGLGMAMGVVQSIAAVTGLRHVANSAQGLMPRGPVTVPVVVVNAERSLEVQPPTTIHERIARLPSGAERIRIEKYGSGDTAQFEVFISGTDSLLNPDNPFDMSQNLALATTDRSASLEAVAAALRRAGATSDSPLVVTGHSQGGLVALALASSERWNVTGIITAGTPVEVVTIPEGIPMIHLEHLEDPVAALAGHPSSDRGETWLSPAPYGERLMDAHAAVTYGESSRVLDSAPSPFVQKVTAEWQIYGRGTATWYSATNVSGASRSGAE